MVYEICYKVYSVRLKIRLKKIDRWFSVVYSSISDPAGTRTQGPIIKSDVLYQLSYEINLFPYPFGFGSAKIQEAGVQAKKNSFTFKMFLHTW